MRKRNKALLLSTMFATLVAGTAMADSTPQAWMKSTEYNTPAGTVTVYDTNGSHDVMKEFAAKVTAAGKWVDLELTPDSDIKIPLMTGVQGNSIYWNSSVAFDKDLHVIGDLPVDYQEGSFYSTADYSMYDVTGRWDNYTSHWVYSAPYSVCWLGGWDMAGDEVLGELGVEHDMYSSVTRHTVGKEEEYVDWVYSEETGTWESYEGIAGCLNWHEGYTKDSHDVQFAWYCGWGDVYLIARADGPILTSWEDMDVNSDEYVAYRITTSDEYKEHNMHDEILVEPTCQAVGWKISKCQNCDYTEGSPVEISKSEHNFVEKSYGTYSQLTCTVCGEVTGDKIYDKIKVQFDLNGGTGSFTSVDILPGSIVNIPDVTPTRTGYKFLGWSTVRNGEVEHAQGAQVTPTVATTYYACWEAEQYQIYFNKVDENLQPIVVTYGQPIGTLPTSPSTGWIEEESGAPVTSTTVYVWNESITLVPADGTDYITVTFVSDSKSMTYQLPKGSEASPPFTPDPGSGYTFKWWSLQRKGPEYDFSIKLYYDTTFYAVIEGNRITVTFMGFGDREYPYGETFGELPVISQQGAEFKGWFWDPDCTQPLSPTELVPAYDVTVYSKFETQKFEVKLEGYDSLFMSQYDMFPALPTPTRDGETFLGWFYGEEKITKGDVYLWNFPIQLRPKFSANMWPVTLPNGEVRMVYEGQTIGNIPTGSVSLGTKVIGFKNQKGETVTSSTPVYGAMTITAIIERNTVTLTLMDGDSVYTTRYVDAGLRVTDLPSLTKNGYTFRGWSQIAGGSVTTGPFYGDTTLYAVYAADMQVITLMELNQTVQKATGAQIGSLPIPTKSGYEFAGWTWNGELVTSETVVPYGGMTLYPKWTAIHIDTTRTVTIRYWSDGIRINTVDMNPGEILYDPGAPALDDLNERTFAYWSVRSGAQYSFGKRVSADLDLYAVWQ